MLGKTFAFKYHLSKMSLISGSPLQAHLNNFGYFSTVLLSSRLINYSNRVQGQDLTRHDWKSETRELGPWAESPERRYLHGFLLFPLFHSCK